MGRISKFKLVEISLNIRKPSWVFDTRSILNKEEVKAHGIKIWQVGCET